jgi:hypothetical protein
VLNPFRLLSGHPPLDESQKRSQDVSTNASPCSPEELSHRIMLEQLRQARCSFNLSLIVIAAGTVIGFTGAGLLLMGKTTEGAVVATGSLLSTGYHLRLVKDANDRLDKTIAVLKERKQ